MAGGTTNDDNANGEALKVLAPGTKIKEVASDSQGADYDFYQILQNKNAASGTATTGSPKNNPQQIFIQAGIFADANAAKDMKGRVAFLGYDANVVVVNNGDGAKNRVVLGPFSSESEALGIKRDLDANGIKSMLIK